MNKNFGTPVLLVLLVAILTGCSKQSDAPQATSSVPVQVAKVESQPTESPKPEIKKKMSVNEIDFSNYSGVIKPGAFGYYFGLSPEQIQEAGIELESTDADGDLTVYKTVEAPLPWDGAETYVLVFMKKSLLKVRAIGKDITGDLTGSSGKEAYKELTTALTEKYGKPSDSLHRTGVSLYRDRDEFYQCLGYDCCGIWFDFFKSPDRVISIELKGLARGKGFIQLIYEAAPEWSQALDQLRADKKGITKKGL